MMPRRAALPFFIILLFFLSPSSPSPLHPPDAAALLNILRSLRDAPGGSFFSSWDPSSVADACTSFSGVLCAVSGGSLRVTVLTLGTGLAGSPGLAGELPESLGGLTELTDLVLYPGRVAGEIPGSIAVGLRRLRLLSLSGNLLSGAVPAALADMPELHTLDLSNNRLSGEIPPALLGCTAALKVLILSGNGNLTGEIPTEFNATALFHLDLSGNKFSGELPPLPPALAYLSLARNAMSGKLAGAFSGELPDLAFLDLSSNGFAGGIPPAIFTLPSLAFVFLDRNNFSDALTVPASRPAPQWSVIDVSHNALSGEVPAALSAARSLVVNNNRFSGKVPAAVAASVAAGKMVSFYAQHNFLTGLAAAAPPLLGTTGVCLEYNCMELSKDGAAGCPASGGPMQPRPAEQCRSS